MENQKEITDPLFFKMLLENLKSIVKEMGVGALNVDYLNHMKVSSHLSLDDYNDPLKVPVLKGEFLIPDGRGVLLSFNMGINKTVVYQRDLDLTEKKLFGGVLFLDFDNESDLFMYHYFYTAVTFISCYESRKKIENEISFTWSEIDDLKKKTDQNNALISGAKSRLNRLEEKLEKFNEDFSDYLIGGNISYS